jgi:hypothetical protein
MICQYQDLLLTAAPKLFHHLQAMEIIDLLHSNHYHLLSFINNNFNPVLHLFNL